MSNEERNIVRDEESSGGCPMSRRRFLQAGVGAGVAASVGTFGPGPLRSALAAAPPQRVLNTFGRMFPGLPPFALPGPALTEALLDIGRPGGMLDARDDLAAGPARLFLENQLSQNNRNNPTQTAGVTFMGQFLDHDITFDKVSPLNVPTEPTKTTNSTTPRFDLDAVYGGGPTVSPELYNPADRDKLRIESGGLFEDLPRRADMSAIIGDPRNDENMIIAGLHCAFILFHNRAVDDVRRTATTGQRIGSVNVFVAARQLTTWHYQWMVVNQFLPLFVGQAMVDNVRTNGRRFFRPTSSALMPVEFQGAAYRFGHSMVRTSYRANMAGDNGNPFFGFIFDPNNPDAVGLSDPGDMIGGFRAPRRFIGWQSFFDFGDGAVRPNKRIDTTLSTPLFNLPLSSIFSRDQPVVLPQRTLLRHVTWSMPSGQAVANSMGVAPLASADLAELAPYGLGLQTSTPLFYYILKEAQLVNDGVFLGPVGGRIVAEVFMGLLELDPGSYLNASPAWRPTLPTRSGAVTGDFRMIDFLTYARVDPASRGQ